MWIVYQIDAPKINIRFYSKQAAKDYVKMVDYRMRGMDKISYYEYNDWLLCKTLAAPIPRR